MKSSFIDLEAISTVPRGSYSSIDMAEVFYDTIQGEGIYTGVPAVFLRVAGCTLNCDFCDTAAIWKNGRNISIAELVAAFNPLVDKLKNGHHLVITGGSPLRQQNSILEFLHSFVLAYKFKPFIEVENECMIFPSEELQLLVDCWNNSPKFHQYNSNIVRKMAEIPNSWFKFVIEKAQNWDLIVDRFLTYNYIQKEQILLMPLGATKKQLNKYSPIALQLAIENGVRYCTREHIVLWNDKKGV